MNSPRRAFHDFPSQKNKAYIEWLNKVKKKKGYFWRDQEIYDLIQLSRISLTFNPNMLIAFFLLWKGSPNIFHLFCLGAIG